MGTPLPATPAEVQQSGDLAGKNVPPPGALPACTGPPERARGCVFFCQDFPRAIFPALSLLAAGQGVALGDLHSLPCPQLPVGEQQSSPRCSPKSHPGMVWRARSCHVRWESAMQHRMDTASAGNYLSPALPRLSGPLTITKPC